MDIGMVRDWLKQLETDDVKMAIELIDCPENGLEAWCSEYGTIHECALHLGKDGTCFVCGNRV